MAGFEPGGSWGGFAAVGRKGTSGDHVIEMIDLFAPWVSGLYHTWYGPSGWRQSPSGELQLERLVAPGADQIFPHRPSAVSWAPDRLDVFATSEQGELWHFWATGVQQPASSWDGESLGHPGHQTLVTAPSAVALDANKITVFVRTGSLGALHACVWDPDAGDRWAWRHAVDDLHWAHQPRNYIFAPAATSWGTDRIDLFGITGTADGGTLEHTWQQDFPDDPAWHPDYWEQPKAFGVTSNPVAISWNDPQEIVVLYCIPTGLLGSGVGMTRWLGQHWVRDVLYQQVSADDGVLSFPALASWGKKRLDAFWLRGPSVPQQPSDLRLQHGWNNVGGKKTDWVWEDFAVAWPSST